MNTTIIEAVLRRRVLIWLAVGIATLASMYALRTAPLDAIPDISDPQIVIYTKWPRSPQLLESAVNDPIVQALVGLPGVAAIRGTSHMGYSFIYVILESASQRRDVEQRVQERLNAVRPQLPADASITLGPNASSMGWVYAYAVVDRAREHDLRELRRLNDRQIKPALQSVPGIAEIASVGGLEKQYQLKLFPPLLARSGLSLTQVTASLQSAFQEVGGRVVEVTNRDYQIRGIIKDQGVDQVEQLVVGRATDGTAVRLKDIGYIQVGYDQRRSIADLDGKGEVIGGIVIMEHDQNVLTVTRALEARLKEIRAQLPQGVELVTTYDRSALIWETLRHFSLTLLYELGVVILITLVFLRNVRIALAPVSVLLLATLFTALPLLAFGQTINLFSLAGLFIAIGEMVDASIVIVENCTAELTAHPGATAQERRQIIVRSIAGVARPLLFSLLIILASFLPVFFLAEREARLFDPLALSKTFAMAFSTLLTLFLLPIVIVWVFKPGAPREHRAEQRLRSVYRTLVSWTIRFRYPFVFANLALLVFAIWIARGLHTDYMPELEEGSILYMPTTLPGLPAKEAGWILQRMDAKLKAFPEVARVFGKLGRADTSTDPAPVTMIETTILLKPKAQWRPGMTKEKLVAEMDRTMQVIGYVNTWVQPISARVLMQGTGIQTPVGLKIRGDDVDTIDALGQKIEAALRDFPGTKSAVAERIAQGYYIDVQLDLSRMAEHGVAADEAAATVRFAIGGDNAIRITEADGDPTPLGIQYSPEYIDTLEKVRTLPVMAGAGRTVALSDIADVSVRKLPEMIRNDNGQLAGYVYIDLQNVTAPDYVRAAKSYLAKTVPIPSGYSVEWTGLYEYAAAAQARLIWIVPATLVIIFALLLMAFRSWSDSLLILLSVPFSLVGGVLLQRILGYPMTTAVVIGYIALFSVAIQTGIIMIIFIRQALASRSSDAPYMDAVLQGSVARLRPKLMTVSATVLSLLPVMLSHGTGIEIMKPIATPTIGGMVTSTIYVLFLIPCLFAIRQDFATRRAARLALAPDRSEPVH
jgi:Cu(I)/Ag(I) efflux system membrane protein CusA/SilA